MNTLTGCSRRWEELPTDCSQPSERSALSEVSFRRHATSGFAQAIVEAAGDLAPVKDVSEVAIEVTQAAAALAGNQAPRDEEEAWWSCQHAVAVTLLGLDLEDDLARDPRVVAIRERVRIKVGSVSRVTVDGRRAERDLAAPLTNRDLEDKWRRLNPDLEPPVGDARVKVALLPGDGVAAEVIAQARKVVDALEVGIVWTVLPWGSDHWHRNGTMMPADAMDVLRGHAAVLMAPLAILRYQTRRPRGA